MKDKSEKDEFEKDESDKVESEKVESNKEESEKVESEKEESEKQESGKVDSEKERVESEKVELVKKYLNESESSDNSHLKLKRFRFNCNAILKNNIYITNKNLSDKVELLCKIFHNINKNKNIKDMSTLYDNNIKFIVSSDDKNEYKKILLDYPYSYFNKFSFSKSLNDTNNFLRQLYVIDYNYIKQNSNEDLYNKIIKLVNSDDNIIHFIFIFSNFYDLNECKELHQKSFILLHNIDMLKSIQKQFYKKIVKPFTENNQIENWDDFKKVLLINDTKTIIINNKELRYN